jgi:adenylate kinase
LHVIILGLPGAGKGTQAARLAKATGQVHITTGELFRENIRRGTELGRKVESYVNKGLLVPDELTISMLLERISEPDCAAGWLLDGFPRNIEQAKALDEALSRDEGSVDSAVYIRVSTDELVRRLGGRWNCRQCGAVYHETSGPPKQAGMCDSCGSDLYQREDDAPDVVRTRLEVNLTQLERLLSHYDEMNKLIEIDGEGRADAVAEALSSALAR